MLYWQYIDKILKSGPHRAFLTSSSLLKLQNGLIEPDHGVREPLTRVQDYAKDEEEPHLDSQDWNGGVTTATTSSTAAVLPIEGGRRPSPILNVLTRR